MRPALARARQADTWFIYPGGIEGWVDFAATKNKPELHLFRRVVNLFYNMLCNKSTVHC